MHPNVDTPRPFKVLQQLVCLSGIDFVERELMGFTELTIAPLDASLRQLRLNCAQQVNLHRVTVGDVDAPFEQHAAAADLARGAAGASLALRPFADASFEAAQRVDADNCGGELLIDVPRHCWPLVAKCAVLKVLIDFWVKEPSVGLQFAGTAAEVDGASSERFYRDSAFHLFTYRALAGDSSTHCWLPCVDSANELCQWKIEVTCDLPLVAVCSGELVDTVFTSDMQQKIYTYQVSVPCSAANIGFAVGAFDVCVHPEMTEVTSFCPPRLAPLVKHSTETVDKMFEFFEELLSCRFPFASYKQVFVDQAADDMTGYSGLSIVSVSLLYHRGVIDCAPHSRTLMAHAVAQQFFGAFIAHRSWLDSWIVRAVARYITALFVQRTFGHNEYLYQIHRCLSAICSFEVSFGPVFLRPLKSERRVRSQLHFDPRNAATCSPGYADMLSKKGHYVIRMLEKRLGREPLLQVLHKVLAMATQAAQQRSKPAGWQAMLLSTESFFKTISSVTGQELPTFLEQWIYGGGHAHFHFDFSFNRKRNCLEVEIRQDAATERGRQKYVGPVSLVVQEMDGCFSHVVQIDDAVSRHDLPCHSKGRRQKKKRVPLSSGEEVELDLSMMDVDSPVLWIRFDPDLLLVRRVELSQPDFQWQYQLRHERDVVAQLQALDVLTRYPSSHVRSALNDVLENHHCFYRVRVQAAFTMAEVANKLQHCWTGPPAMLKQFRAIYGSRSCEQIVRPNHWTVTASSLQHYFLMQARPQRCPFCDVVSAFQAIPQAMAQLRSVHSQCPPEVHQFLLDLIKFNDNSKNRYLDDYYRSAVLSALSQTAAPSRGAFGSAPKALKDLPPDVGAIVRELLLALNLEGLRPSHGRCVAIACIKGLYRLQHFGHLPPDASFFWAYAQPGQYHKVRVAAIDCLVDYVNAQKRRDGGSVMDALLDVCESERDPLVRYHAAAALSSRPPFCCRQPDVAWTHPVNTASLARRLWRLLHEATDMRLRGYLVDLYHALYGNAQPQCLAEAGRGALPMHPRGRPLTPDETQLGAATSSASSLNRPGRPGIAGAAAMPSSPFDANNPNNTKSSGEISD